MKELKACADLKKGVGAWGLSECGGWKIYQSTKKPYTRRGKPRFTKYNKVSYIKRHPISIYLLLHRFSWPQD
ncbi:unnamed protein product [marine sediment metagenome]|uniref:Uncharacterized protein n=1 Tax=marine sediment metagenome TaxID=412755 RepID=X1IQM1_9ZZZZ